MNQLQLVTFTGNDRLGVTAEVTAILAAHGVEILDIGQAVIHNTLTLGLLLEIHLDQVVNLDRALRDKAGLLGLSMRLENISVDSYQAWVSQQGKDRHIITLLARKITAQHLAELTAVAVKHQLNFDDITRLTGRVPLSQHLDKSESGDFHRKNKACVEFSARGKPENIAQLRADFLELSSRLDIDIAIQADSLFRRNRRLVCFDMDSTLVEAEVIDELAKRAGVGEQVAAITERAMRGELEFNDSFRQRMALLKGLDAEVLAEIAEKLPITEGAEHLLRTLHSLGYKTAILSGGFTYFAERLQQKFGIDYVYANQLEIVDGKITGRVIGEIINGDKKAQLLKTLAEKENIRLEQVIAVGDGANDLPMLSVAGLGIAFRAKPLVKASAKQSISQLGLDGILYLLGLRDRETETQPMVNSR
jgi:phosphoserine phosphatase